VSNGAAGVTFTETMRGGFFLGATEPKEGARRGELHGSELAFHARVVVPDVDTFIADPAHAGQLSGKIELTPWGVPVEGTGGVFNLFKPGGEPSLRLMVYELPFTREGTEYYLAGQKVIRDDFFDMWRQTTTLFTRLHQGRDKSAPVVGAGVITVGIGGFIGVVSGMKGIGTVSREKASEAVARFARFFMGGLWDSYVAHRPAEG
jgi:hypothetical protein